MKSFILLLLLSSVTIAQVPINEKSQLPGYSTAKISKDGRVTLKSFGYSDLENEIVRKNNSRQNIASITKTFLGVAILQLVEQNLVSLSTPINDILPFKVVNPRHPDIPITLAMLTNHTSSIRDSEIGLHSAFLTNENQLKKLKVSRETKQFLKQWQKNIPEDLHSFLKSALLQDGDYFTRKRFSKKPPGSKHEYSNLGAALAGYIVELIVNMPLSDYIQEEIFNPLEMHNSSWDYLEKNEVARYYFGNKVPVPDYVSTTYPAGGINSTCEDLAKFLAELIQCLHSRDGLITQEAAHMMFSSQLTPEQNTLKIEKSYGLFTEINGNNVGHNGGNYGVTALMSFDSKTGKGKIMITNTSGYESPETLAEIIKIYKEI